MSTAFHQNLAAFKLDPALLLPSVFADTPPPSPSLDGITLPEDWLQQLGTQHVDASDFFNDKYPGYKAREALLKDLQFVYARLFGLLDEQLGKVTAAEIEDTVAVLKYGLTQCAEGFHNRLNIILSSYAQPKNLFQLLYKVRMDLAEKAAALIATEIHGQNTVFGVGETLGLGIRMINPLDDYSGGVSEAEAKRVLKETFEKQFRALALPFLLCEQLEKIAASYGYLGRNETPEGYETAENSLIPLLGERINKIIGYEVNDANLSPNDRKYDPELDIPFRLEFFEIDEETDAVREIDWLKLARYLLEKLKLNCINGELAFENPKKTLLDCTQGYRLCEDKIKPYFIGQGAEILFQQLAWKNDVERDAFFDEIIRLRRDSLPYYQDLEIRGCFEFLKRELVESLSASFASLQKLNTDADREKWIKRNQSKLQLLPVLTDLNQEIIHQLFIQKTGENYNVLMLIAKYGPQALEPALIFFKNSSEFLSNDLWRELCITMLSQTGGYWLEYNALMIAARYQPQVVASLLTFFENSRELLGDEEWRKLCITLLSQTGESQYKRNLLMIAARYQPQAVAPLLTFFENSRELLGDEEWKKLCITLLGADKNDLNKDTVLTIALDYQPQVVKSLLTFVENCRKLLGNDEWSKLCKTMLNQKDTVRQNALMIAARCPQALQSLLEFFENSREFLGGEVWQELCITTLSQTGDLDEYNALMIAVRYQPQVVKPLLTFVENSREFLGNDAWSKFCITILSQNGWNCDTLYHNALMSAARYQPQLVKPLLTFVENSREFLGNDAWSKLCMTMLSQTNTDKWNALMLAAQYQSQAINPLLDFLLQHPDVFNQTISYQIVFDNLSKIGSLSCQWLMKKLTEKLSHYFTLAISKIESDPEKHTWANSLPLLFGVNAESISEIFKKEKRSVKTNVFLFNSLVHENAEFVLQKIGRDKFCHLYINCLWESKDANDKDILQALNEALNPNTSLAQFFAQHQGLTQFFASVINVGDTTSVTFIKSEIKKYEKRLANKSQDAAVSETKHCTSIPKPLVSIPEQSAPIPAQEELVVPVPVSETPAPMRLSVASLSLSLFEPDKLPDPKLNPEKFYDPGKFSQAELLAIQSPLITAQEVSAGEKNPEPEAIVPLDPLRKLSRD